LKEKVDFYSLMLLVDISNLTIDFPVHLVSISKLTLLKEII